MDDMDVPIAHQTQTPRLTNSGTKLFQVICTNCNAIMNMKSNSLKVYIYLIFLLVSTCDYFILDLKSEFNQMKNKTLMTPEVGRNRHSRDGGNLFLEWYES